MKKQFAVIAIALLALIGCNKQQPTQVKNNVSSETSFSKWLGEGQRFDKDGNLRVPTFLVRNGKDTTYLPFEKWGIAEKKLSKISGYTWDYTIYVYNVNVDIQPTESASVWIYPFFDAGTYDHVSRAGAYCYAYDLDASNVEFWQNRYRITWNPGCTSYDVNFWPNSDAFHTVNDNGFAWYFTNWSDYAEETYSGSCNPNSGHYLLIDNNNGSDFPIVADDFVFYVNY